MLVIMLSDVKGVGKKGQTIEVSDGYGNNYLIPRRLAVLATKRSREILDLQQENVRLQAAQKKAEAESISEKLTKITIEFQAPSGKDGKMFGSISAKQISESLKKDHQIVIDKRKFLDHDSVNVFGTTKIRVELYKGVIGVLTVHVSEKER